jgi:hypothetical protein
VEVNIHRLSHSRNTDTFPRLGSLVKSDDGTYELIVPRYSPTATNALLWVQKDLGSSVIGLLKNYQDHGDEILNKTFYVANAHITYPDFAKILSAGQFSHYHRRTPSYLMFKPAQ